MQVLIFFLAITAVVAFRHPSWLSRRIGNPVYARRISASDDDLFDTTKKSPDSNIPKKRYLEEDWQLTEQEDVALEPFRKKVAAMKKVDDAGLETDAEVVESAPLIPDVPMFALVYKFKSTYKDASLKESIESHKDYCRQFSHIVSDEIINSVDGRGVVSLWVGTPEEGEEPVKLEIEKFVSADPFVNEGLVEQWDILDIGTTEKQLSPEEEVEFAKLEQARKEELEQILSDSE